MGASVDLTIVSLAGDQIHISQQGEPFTSSSGATTYSLSDTLPLMQVSAAATGQILTFDNGQTSILGVEADPIATAGSSLADLQINLTEIATFLTASVANVTSTAQISGSCCTGLQANGTASTANAVLSCFIGSGITLPTDPAPNTVVDDALGLRVTLNEQTVSGDGVSGLQMTVNAIHVQLDNVLISGLGSISGDVIVGQSIAGLACNGVVGGLACAGDCDRNGIVTVGELVTAVNVGLGNEPLMDCTAADADGSQTVTVSELVTAVHDLLFGCPSGGR